MSRAIFCLPLFALLLLTACATEGENETQPEVEAVPEATLPALVDAKVHEDSDAAATRDLQARLDQQRVKVKVDLRASQLADWLRREADFDVLMGVSAIEGHWTDEIHYANPHPLPWGQVIHDMLAPIGMRYHVANGIIYLESTVNN